MVFPVVMYGCESWTVKKAELNWCFQIVEKTLESALDCKEIQPVHPKGDQPWDFFGRNDAKAETPVLWPPHVKSWLIGKESDAGRDWGQEEKGTTEDEMAGWHHRLDGRESEWTPGVGDGQGGLVCCGSWGCEESDTTEWLNWTDLRLSPLWSSQCHFSPESLETGYVTIYLAWFNTLCSSCFLAFSFSFSHLLKLALQVSLYLEIRKSCFTFWVHL